MSGDLERSPRLTMPLIQAAQAQKHVTHNEALRVLDAVVQLAVRGVADAPPIAPEEGALWIVGAGAEDAFEGRAGAVAEAEGGAWSFLAPRAGWLAWNEGEGRLLVFSEVGWAPVVSEGGAQSADRLGVGGAEPDDANRLAVASEGVLLAHRGGDVRLKLSKAAAADTASVVWQTAFGGRAEIGTAGDDDLRVKTSPDGATWHEAMVVEGATGRVRFPAGADGLSDPRFGGGGAVTAAYVASRGADLVANGTGLLGNGYNFPGFAFDASVTPNLPGAFVHRGHYTGQVFGAELLPVDPNQVYRASCYVRMDSIAGDWSAYADGSRHKQYVGLAAYDVDGLPIAPMHHMRHRRNGVDSLTTLAAPLTPGDTAVHLTDASGWNDMNPIAYRRGILILAYRNAAGALYRDYSRIAALDLFDLSGVDRAAGRIDLKAPLPAAMGNPDHPEGTWPSGTRLANSDSGGQYKYVAAAGIVPPADDIWYRCTGHVGGIDLSGRNALDNFAPGTAAVRLMWLPNYTNVVGGSGVYPDTGPNHAVRFAGLSVLPEPLAAQERQVDGSVALKVPTTDFDAGTVSLTPVARTVTPL